MSSKKVADSFTTFTEIVMPNDTNPMHNLMGGNLLKWMAGMQNHQPQIF